MEACLKKFPAEKEKMMAEQNAGPVKRGSVSISGNLIGKLNLIESLPQCLAECIYNGTGHGDLTSEMNPADFIKEIESKGLPAEWTPAFKSMADFCFPEAMKHKDDFEAGFKLPPMAPGDQVCHPKFGFALMCSAKELLRHCPEKFFKPTDECKQLQDFAKTCEL